jgi:hypothetical protein
MRLEFLVSRGHLTNCQYFLDRSVLHAWVRASKPFHLLDSVGPNTSWNHDLHGIALGPSN